MATYNGTPIPSGFVQDTYKDQMGSALAGQLVSASDINLTDSVLVDEADGIVCGLGVTSAINTSARRAGVNDTTISLPSGSETANDFAGIVVRPTSAFSSDSKDAYVKDNWGATLLSAIRVGGRIWAKVFSGSATAGSVPYWRVKADVTAETTTPIGGLCGAAITGVTAAVAATGTVTNSAVPADGSNLKVGSVTYRFKGTMAQAGDVKLEATLDATMAHLVKVLNGTATEGVDCYAGTTQQGTVVLSAYNSPVLSITAVDAGTSGNSIALEKTGSTMIVSGATLTGGAAAVTTTDTVALTGKAKWNSSASAGGLAKIVLG